MKKSYNDLLEGYRFFKQSSAAGTPIEDKQNPKFLVISCSDSRVVPSIIFNAQAGDIFTARNIANLIPPYDKRHSSYHGTSAVIEYAVSILKIKHIIVLGHTKCGGIQTLIKKYTQSDFSTDFVSKWMEIAKPALDKVAAMQGLDDKQKCEMCEKESIKISLNNLHSFPFVNAAIAAGTLQLHGIIFDIETCRLHEYNPQTDCFEEIL